MTNDAAASGAPRFDVVLRGYDRRQVDEHVARMQRVIGRMRADLELARSQPLPIIPAPGLGVNTAGSPPPPPAQPGQRPRPSPSPRPRPRPGGEPGDVVGSFTDRMQVILSQAEEEAAEIRKNARSAAMAETNAARAEVAELARQRDIMITELNRLRGQLENMLSAPTAKMTSVMPSKPVKAPAEQTPPEKTPPGKTPVQRAPGQSASGEKPPVEKAVPKPADEPRATGPQPVMPPPEPVAVSAEAEPTTVQPVVGRSAGGTPVVKEPAGSATGEEKPDVADKPAPAEPVSAAAPDAAKPSAPESPKPKRPAAVSSMPARPGAEPGSLFRSKAQGATDIEATMKVPAVRPGSDEATVVAGRLRPGPKTDSSSPQAKPEPGAAPVAPGHLWPGFRKDVRPPQSRPEPDEATVVAVPLRPGSDEATVVASPLRPEPKKDVRPPQGKPGSTVSTSAPSRSG